MRKIFSIAFITVAVFVVYSCNKEKQSVTPATAIYLDLPAKPASYFSASSGMSPAIIDSQNRLATLGRVLFYETRLSLNNAISCGSCHKQAIGFADNVRFSRGFEGRLTARNSPGISDLPRFGFLFWDAREQVLTNLIMRPVTNHVEMGIEDMNSLPGKLADAQYYGPLFKNAFGDENITLERISNAMAVFLESIGNTANTRVNPNAGDKDLSAEQLMGKALFDTVYNCGTCHIGGGGNGYGGSGLVLDIGLDEVYSDNGLGAVTLSKTDNGKFKVPNLTNVALTAPYMHDGRYNTLDEVLEHYSRGIANSANLTFLLRGTGNDPDNPTGPARKMNITERDKKAMIAFLGTLTDHATNSDPKFSNPFKTK